MAEPERMPTEARNEAEGAGLPAVPWLKRHRPKLLLALRMTVASLAAFAIAAVFALPQAYWAVLTALLVTQGSVGGSLKAALDRLVGSLCGAIWGAAVALMLPDRSALPLAGALGVGVLPLAVGAAFNVGFRIAPVTAIIVLLSTAATELGPLGYATERVLEIALGSVIGVLVSRLVLPARAHGLVLEAAAETAALLARQLEALARGARGDAQEVVRLNTQTWKFLARLEMLSTEAAHERRSRLSDEPDPEPFFRTLRRLRHDIVILARAATEPWPESVAAVLGEPCNDALHSAAAALRGASVAVAARRAPPAPDAFARAVAAYEASIGEVRRRGVTRELSVDAVGHIFSVDFGLRQLQRDLADLLARIAESAQSR